MKKGLLVLVLIALTLTACSGGDKETAKVSMDSFINAYKDAGVEVDPDEKQMYQAVGAKDGIMFYVGNSVVKLYEFKSEKELKSSLEKNNFSDWPSNGRFAIETSSQEALDIFQKVQ